MKIGANDINAVKIGSTDVNKVYLGSNLVWEKASPALYELYYDVNGLLIDSTNTFGTVDDLGNISSFISTSPALEADELIQGTLVSRPNLIVDHFGVGKNAILFNGTSDYLIKANTTFTPDWDEEFWIAGKFKSNGSPDRIMLSFGNPVIGGRGVRTQFLSDNSFGIVLVAQNGAYKFTQTVSTYNDNLEHTYIAHWKGTDNILDAKIYIDGSLASTTPTSSGSFVGSSLYNQTDQINLLLGVRNDVPASARWNQYLGKHILGFGSPNVQAITNSLNSDSSVYWDGSQTGLLDDYPNASAAYSLRALNSAYTGAAIKVRRSSDNAEQDIRLLYDGSLDTSSLLSFVGAGDGFISTWYDQSGSGNNATQSNASKQPFIVSSGLVVMENNNPAALFLSTLLNDLSLTQYPFTSGGSETEKSIFAVAKNDSTANQNLYNIADNRDVYALTYNRSGNNTYGFLGANYGNIGGNISGQSIISSLAISPSSKTFTNSIEGVSSNLVRGNFNEITIGSRGGLYSMNGTIQELVMYESDQSTNRASIESNINSHYSIY